MRLVTTAGPTVDLLKRVSIQKGLCRRFVTTDVRHLVDTNSTVGNCYATIPFKSEPS